MSLETLGKIALGGLFMIPITGYAARWLVQGKIQKSASYGLAMECIKSHEVTKQLLGEPIIEGSIDIGDNESCGQNGNVKWFTVLVKGPKAVGTVTYWITSSDNDFEISKISLKLRGSSKETVLIKDTSNTATSTK